MVNGPFHERLFVCSADELERFKTRHISHLLTISNPGAPPPQPHWFSGEHLQLWFGDVVSEADAQKCRTKAPVMDDLRCAADFFRTAWSLSPSKILVSCDYGASRSPALAYVFVADQLG